MKNYKKIIVGSLMTALIIASPLATFAEGKNNDKDNNKVKSVKTVNTKLDKDQNGNYFFKGFANVKSKKEITNVNSNLIPLIEGITAPTVLKAGELGTWVVKATDPNNGSLSYSVDWGDKNIVSKSLAMLSTPIFVQTGTFTHTYANKGEYKITFTVKNEAGLKTASKITVHITKVENTIAPVISDLTVTSVKKNKATLNWTTDTKSNTLVWFSTVSPVDTTLKQNNSRKAKVLNHKIEIKKLEANTKYYLIVGSTNKIGLTKSVETSFTTPAIVAMTAITNNGSIPIITSVTGPKTVTVGDTETVKINAYDPNNKTLSYSADWGDGIIILDNALVVSTTHPVFAQKATLSHIYSNAGVYTATFTVKNEEGKTATSTLKITVTPVEH